jgi:hypothetical protein
MDPESPLIHTKHVFRASILLLAVVGALLLGRSLFVPATWGEYGWYRGAAIDDHRARPVSHLGDETCAMCHDDEFVVHAEGAHADVRCELCHGPVVLHANLEDGEKIAEMPIRRSRELCELCHRRLDARPASFPQIDVREHLTDQGVDLSPDACFDCHDPHSPY